MHAPGPRLGAAEATDAALRAARAEVDAILKALDAIALGQRHPRDPADWIFAALALHAPAVLRDARARIGDRDVAGRVTSAMCPWLEPPRVYVLMILAGAALLVLCR